MIILIWLAAPFIVVIALNMDYWNKVKNFVKVEGTVTDDMRDEDDDSPHKVSVGRYVSYEYNGFRYENIKLNGSREKLGGKVSLYVNPSKPDDIIRTDCAKENFIMYIMYFPVPLIILVILTYFI